MGSGNRHPFALYGILYMTREILRMMSITSNYDLWILTDTEVSFCNLFFAFIALIFGQSVCFSFWFERPGKTFGQRLHKRISVINDQKVLNWFFLSAYSKLAWGLGAVYASFYAYYSFFYSNNPHGNFLDDNTSFPTYNLVYILIIIVLFLQMWTTIRLVFKDKSLKWMFASMLILSVLAFGLSKINLIDYRAINASILKHNVQYSHKIELPDVTDYHVDYFRRGGRTNDIYFAQNSTEENGEPVILFEGEEKVFEAISNKIKTGNSYYWIHEELYLHFHRKIKMNQVWKVYEEMGKANFNKFGFVVVKTHYKNDKKYYQNHLISVRISAQYMDTLIRPPMDELYKGLKKMDDIIEIRQAKFGHFVDGVLLENEAFKSTISKRIRKSSPKYVIKLYIKDDANIESYLQTLSLIKETVLRTWDEYAIQQYGEKEKALDYEKRREIRSKFRYAVFEITEEMAAKYE